MAPPGVPGLIKVFRQLSFLVKKVVKEDALKKDFVFLVRSAPW